MTAQEFAELLWENGWQCGGDAQLDNLKKIWENLPTICAKSAQSNWELQAKIDEAVSHAENACVKYHIDGMGCGLEDHSITDKYEAMEYGWGEAVDRIYLEVVNPLVDILTNKN